MTMPTSGMLSKVSFEEWGPIVLVFRIRISGCTSFHDDDWCSRISWTTIIPQLELISDQETDSHGSDSTGWILCRFSADSPINSQQGPFQAHRLLPDRANAPKLEKCEARGQVFVFPCKYFPGLVESLTGFDWVMKCCEYLL